MARWANVEDIDDGFFQKVDNMDVYLEESSNYYDSILELEGITVSDITNRYPMMTELCILKAKVKYCQMSGKLELEESLKGELIHNENTFLNPLIQRIKDDLTTAGEDITPFSTMVSGRIYRA